MGVFEMLKIEEIVKEYEANLEAARGTTIYSVNADKGKGSLDIGEIRAINKRLMSVAENEEVFACLWRAREAIYDMVRAVKWERKKGKFVGEGAEGDDLDLILARPQDIKKAGTALTTWLFSATAGTDYYESDSGDGKLTLGTGANAEGRVYCGWADPIDSPKMVAVLYELPKRNILEPTPFELNKDYPVIAHTPIEIFPGNSYRIQCRYHTNGDDMARPICVIIKAAEKFSL
ncbi:hypothetical protein J7L81_05145 [Candidatus Aerophobetes bacterium]|nr:hypothetical protein [Candidatus Aerophobetes bacterium]